MKSNLIAPCGMNCSLCIAHLRDKNKCPGCRLTDCKKCTIKNCKILQKNNWKYCSIKCEKFPCTRLKKIDERYRTKYGMSMLENIDFIYKKGIEDFIKHERAKWIKNNRIFCVHNKRYYDIKKKRLKKETRE